MGKGPAHAVEPLGEVERRRPFLFPVKALSPVFRAKFIAALARARRCGTLHYLGQSAALADPGPWETLIATLWQHDWVVYAKPPFGGPQHVLKYLSRYTHRVAITNQRRLSVAHGVVRFAYRDSAAPNARTALSLPATEFLRRFPLHVVPKGFMRIRHYGITANRCREAKLARCRELLGTTAHPRPPLRRCRRAPTPLPRPRQTPLGAVPSAGHPCASSSSGRRSPTTAHDPACLPAASSLPSNDRRVRYAAVCPVYACVPCTDRRVTTCCTRGAPHPCHPTPPRPCQPTVFIAIRALSGIQPP